MYAPQFPTAFIFANASERDAIGKVIANVTATDADVDVPLNQFVSIDVYTVIYVGFIGRLSWVNYLVFSSN